MKKQLLNIKTWIKISPYLLTVLGGVLLYTNKSEPLYSERPPLIETTVEDLHKIKASDTETPVKVTGGYIAWVFSVAGYKEYSYGNQFHSDNNKPNKRSYDTVVVPYFEGEVYDYFIQHERLPANYTPIYITMSWDQLRVVNSRIAEVIEKKMPEDMLRDEDIVTQTDLTFAYSKTSGSRVNSILNQKIKEVIGEEAQPIFIDFDSVAKGKYLGYSEGSLLGLPFLLVGLGWLTVSFIKSRIKKAATNCTLNSQNVSDQSTAAANGLKSYSTSQLARLITDSNTITVISIIWLLGGIICVGLFCFGVQDNEDVFITIGVIGSSILIPASIGLMMRTGWGRVCGYITSIILLAGIPIGTIIGITSLICLTRSGQLFGKSRITHQEIKDEFQLRLLVGHYAK